MKEEKGKGENGFVCRYASVVEQTGPQFCAWYFCGCTIERSRADYRRITVDRYPPARARANELFFFSRIALSHERARSRPEESLCIIQRRPHLSSREMVQFLVKKRGNPPP